jgi:hypothetical protein
MATKNGKRCLMCGAGNAKEFTTPASDGELYTYDLCARHGKSWVGAQQAFNSLVRQSAAVLTQQRDQEGK